MRTLCDSLPLAELMAKLDEPSCAERAAKVTGERLVRWANAMAKAGYRHSEDTLDALRLYIAGYGLLVFGGVGVGKTFFFRAAGRAAKALVAPDAPEPFVWNMMGVAGRRMDEIRAKLLALRDREVVVDDVGAEPVYNEFGSRWEILPWILEMRLESGSRTHFTTNLSPADIERRYGARTVDRMHEMAASATFGGRSRRETRPNARAAAMMSKSAERFEFQRGETA